MKMIIAVVQGSDVDAILDALGETTHRVTQIDSAGGYLREANVTLLIGAEDDEIRSVVNIIEENSKARRKFVNPLMPFASVSDGDEESSVRVGASVFIVNISRFERLTG